jgi:O-antigen/teichoic acid export membrane protein
MTRSPEVARADAEYLDSPAASTAAVRGGALRVAGYLTGVALSIGSAALLFRYLGVADAGRYVTVISLIGIAQGLTDVGISALGVREMATLDAIARKEFLRTLLGLRLTMTVVGVAGAVIFAWLAGYASNLVLGTALAGAGLVVQNLQSTFAIPLASSLRLGWVAAADLCRQVVTSVGIVALVLAGAALLPFFALTIIAAFAALAMTIPLLRPGMPLTAAWRPLQWRELLREALPFVVATAVYGMYFRVAVILVSLLTNETQAGYFGAAFRILEVLLLIPALAVGAVFPIFARAARDDFTRFAAGVQRTFDTALVVAAGAGLALVLGAPLAIDIIAGDEFRPAVEVLRIEAIALAAAFVSQTFGFALLSLHRHRALLLMSLVGLALTSSLTALLAHGDGARGAAIAVAAGEVGLAVTAGLAFACHTPRPHLSFRVLPRLAVATGGAALAAIFASTSSLLMLAVGMVVYVSLAAGLRLVPPELLRLVRIGT